MIEGMNALVYAVKLIIMDDPQDSINVSSTEPENRGTESVEALWARSKNQPSKYESDSESDSGFLKYSPMTIASLKGGLHVYPIPQKQWKQILADVC